MTTAPERPPQNDINSDLGFGSVVSREVRSRLLNRDGSFNVRREGLGWWARFNVYHYSISITWPRFLFFVMAGYFVVNALFALGYLACGPRAIAGIGDKPAGERFLASFFFSVHTLATIGYGNMVPISVAANLLVTVESLIGLLGFSVVAALAFARFARPVAHIVFSRNAIIAPYRDITAFMFRVVNQKASEVVELEATVLMTRRRKDGAYADREYIPLKLERERVVFFPAPWHIVHPIDEKSPLWGKTHEELVASGAEFLVRLTGFDDTFSQTVHSRSSYTASEIVWGARFRNVFNPLRPDGSVSVDIRKLHEFERVPLPTAPPS